MFPDRPVDASHPDTWLDFDRCILCELCVRASADVDGKKFYRVRMGNYPTYDEAVAAKADFEKKVPKIAYVTRL